MQQCDRGCKLERLLSAPEVPNSSSDSADVAHIALFYVHWILCQHRQPHGAQVEQGWTCMYLRMLLGQAGNP